ncbi:MAG: Gfo/Idh/MocA family oxidoreductase [Deltaproteobacteria bacterium]|uniref:Gfo/Idh/MocA family oxidoreductase n=1 Tax=Candidatus Zymogenus saltonus TaxID=2844893 RepID=A0A9D8KER9_9DELT|nr:Gfo/Idh/MocA family oxidoreductase [Candidatus Zymogenus saltonus]
MAQQVTIAQIGCGYWGPNLLRNFYRIENVKIKYVAEVSEERRIYVASNYKDIKVISDYTEILNDEEVDAVIIATPANDHYKHVMSALSSGKHCLVEKPLSLKTDEAAEIISMAEERDLVLMVGHTFLYNAAVHKLKEKIDEGELGEIHYIYSQRLNLGRIRSDINAMWNFAPHDVSISLFLIDSEPEWVSAIGEAYIQEGVEDVVFLTVKFKNGTIFNVHISWLDPNKVRRITVVGSKKMVVYDDVADYKIQIFDKGIDKVNMERSLGSYDDFGKFQLIHRAGDLLIPSIDFTEPLSLEARDFINCIINNGKPVSDGESALMVTKILEGATRSLSNKGERIYL